MKKLYIITGAFGHLGNTLVKMLLQKGERVRCLALPQENLSCVDIPASDNIRVITGDVLDKDSLHALFALDDSPCEVIVIHAAGIVSIASKYVQKVVDVNVTGTKNIIEMCLEHNVSKLIYISSVHAIPELPDRRTITEVDSFEPDLVEGLYAKTKAEATQLVLNSKHRGLHAVVVHPSGIIGPGDYGHNHLNQMVIDYINGSLTSLVEGGFDFVDVRDVAQGILLAEEYGGPGQCYILSNRYFSVKELADLIHEVSGKRKISRILPRWFVKLVAPLAELYYKLLRRPPLFTGYSLYTLTSNSNFSHEKANRALGYTTRSMSETLRDTISFLKQHGRIKAKNLRQ
ncbi:MAG: SDR family NAD(P)-dependent oxidoreductase [Anaerovoracaceae bacterium]|jgi:dihydroflavonol-4-reductase